MVIYKGDKFYFVLVDKKNISKVIYTDKQVFNNYEECRKIATETAKEKGLYFGIRKLQK